MDKLRFIWVLGCLWTFLVTTNIGRSDAATLAPPLPPIKVLAAMGHANPRGHPRYYSYNQRDENRDQRPVKDWDSYSSNDPFESLSLTSIAEMMRKRDGDHRPSSRDEDWNRPDIPRPLSQQREGWGWPEPPKTIPRPLLPPTTEGWGWSQRPETRLPPRPPPPPRPTEGWGWSQRSQENGKGSYSFVDRKDTEHGRFWHHGSDNGNSHSQSSVWHQPTTTPKYNPKYLSSDEEKYKPIRYPSSASSSSHHDRPSHNSIWGNSQSQSGPSRPSSGSQQHWPESPGNRPHQHSSWPQSHDIQQGSGWHQNQQLPTRPPLRPITQAPWQDRRQGWGWHEPTRPPPTEPPKSGWGWSKENDNQMQSSSPFEYIPGVDDLRQNIPPDTYIQTEPHIRSDYPPGINYKNSFEDEEEDFPNEGNHYRLVNYTPSPEERYEILEKLREWKKSGKYDDSIVSPPIGEWTKKHASKIMVMIKEADGSFGDKEITTPKDDGEDSREKWFLDNFQRGKTTTTTTKAPTTTSSKMKSKSTATSFVTSSSSTNAKRESSGTSGTIGSKRPNSTTKAPTSLPTSGSRKTTTSSSSSGTRGPPVAMSSVTEIKKSDSPQIKRTRYDSQGFKYEEPVVKRITASQRDIYEDTVFRPSKNFALNSKKEKDQYEAQGSEVLSEIVRFKSSPGRIQLWSSDDHPIIGGYESVGKSNEGERFRIAHDLDIGRFLSSPPPFYTKNLNKDSRDGSEPLLDRKDFENNASEKPCLVGKIYSDETKSCEESTILEDFEDGGEIETEMDKTPIQGTKSKISTSTKKIPPATPRTPAKLFGRGPSKFFKASTTARSTTRTTKAAEVPKTTKTTLKRNVPELSTTGSTTMKPVAKIKPTLSATLFNNKNRSTNRIKTLADLKAASAKMVSTTTAKYVPPERLTSEPDSPTEKMKETTQKSTETT